MNKKTKLKEFIQKLVKEYTGTGASGGNAGDGNSITSPRPFSDDMEEIENYIFKNIYGGEGGQRVGDKSTGNYPNRHKMPMFEDENQMRKFIRTEIRKYYGVHDTYGASPGQTRNLSGRPGVWEQIKLQEAEAGTAAYKGGPRYGDEEMKHLDYLRKLMASSVTCREPDAWQYNEYCPKPGAQTLAKKDDYVFEFRKYGRDRGDIDPGSLSDFFKGIMGKVPMGGSWTVTARASLMSKLIEIMITNESWGKDEYSEDYMTQEGMLVYLKNDKWTFANGLELPSDAKKLAQEAFMALRNKLDGAMESVGLKVDPNEDYGVLWRPNPGKQLIKKEKAEIEKINEQMNPATQARFTNKKIDLQKDLAQVDIDMTREQLKGIASAYQKQVSQISQQISNIEQQIVDAVSQKSGQTSDIRNLKRELSDLEEDEDIPEDVKDKRREEINKNLDKKENELKSIKDKLIQLDKQKTQVFTQQSQASSANTKQVRSVKDQIRTQKQAMNKIGKIQEMQEYFKDTQSNLMERMDSYRKEAKRFILMEGAMQKFFKMFDGGMTNEEIIQDYASQGTQVPETFVSNARKQYEGYKKLKLELEISEKEFKNSAKDIVNNPEEEYSTDSEEKVLASGLFKENILKNQIKKELINLKK